VGNKNAASCLRDKFWTKDLNKHFFKENIQMAKGHMRKYSTSLITRETTVRHHFILTRNATISLVVSFRRM
jgi:hypothetical protein